MPRSNLTENDFSDILNQIQSSKQKTVTCNKHFYGLNTTDKIEIKEEIEKLEILVRESVDEVDRLVYGLYGLSDGEINIVEGER